MLLSFFYAVGVYGRPWLAGIRHKMFSLSSADSLGKKRRVISRTSRSSNVYQLSCEEISGDATDKRKEMFYQPYLKT